jgi:predicted restriction endonuclease
MRHNRTQESAVLEAAHIVPVKAGGTHSLKNALLLRADLYLFFDSGLLTVSPNHTIRVDPSVKDGGYKRLNGAKISLPHGVDRKELSAALTRHRKLFEN